MILLAFIIVSVQIARLNATVSKILRSFEEAQKGNYEARRENDHLGKLLKEKIDTCAHYLGDISGGTNPCATYLRELRDEVKQGKKIIRKIALFYLSKPDPVPEDLE